MNHLNRIEAYLTALDYEDGRDVFFYELRSTQTGRAWASMLHANNRLDAEVIIFGTAKLNKYFQVLELFNMDVAAEMQLGPCLFNELKTH